MYDATIIIVSITKNFFENEGIESKPYNHFGSAPKFLVVNLEGQEIEVIDNGDLNHEHGKCQPLKALANKSVDVVIVRGIGAGAISKLNSMGTKVYRYWFGAYWETKEWYVAYSTDISKNMETECNG